MNHVTLYEQRFEKVHQLLAEFGAHATYDREPEYQPYPILGGRNFHKPEAEMHNDSNDRSWEEKIDAKLDVCLQAPDARTNYKTIRFDISWSNNAKLYSMYVSLPTSGRSESLSLKRFKAQDKLIEEVMFWLNKYKCRCGKSMAEKAAAAKKADTKPKVEQLNLF
jgi:hypothetical protein